MTEALMIRYYDKHKQIYCIHKRKSTNSATVSFTAENDLLDTADNHEAGGGTYLLVMSFHTQTSDGPVCL
jgi:hypothetical protein